MPPTPEREKDGAVEGTEFEGSPEKREAERALAELLALRRPPQPGGEGGLAAAALGRGEMDAWPLPDPLLPTPDPHPAALPQTPSPNLHRAALFSDPLPTPPPRCSAPKPRPPSYCSAPRPPLCCSVLRPLPQTPTLLLCPQTQTPTLLVCPQTPMSVATPSPRHSLTLPSAPQCWR